MASGPSLVARCTLSGGRMVAVGAVYAREVDAISSTVDAMDSAVGAMDAILPQMDPP